MCPSIPRHNQDRANTNLTSHASSITQSSPRVGYVLSNAVHSIPFALPCPPCLVRDDKHVSPIRLRTAQSLLVLAQVFHVHAAILQTRLFDGQPNYVHEILAHEHEIELHASLALGWLGLEPFKNA